MRNFVRKCEELFEFILTLSEGPALHSYIHHVCNVLVVLFVALMQEQLLSLFNNNDLCCIIVNYKNACMALLNNV